MSARTTIAAEIKDHEDLPSTWKVIDHAPAVSASVPTGKTLVVVFRSAIGRSPVHAGFANTIDIWVLVGEEDVALVEDELDKRLDVIVPILDAAGFEYSLERGVYADRWHGWHATVPMYTDTP